MPSFILNALEFFWFCNIVVKSPHFNGLFLFAGKKPVQGLRIDNFTSVNNSIILQEMETKILTLASQTNLFKNQLRHGRAPSQ